MKNKSLEYRRYKIINKKEIAPDTALFRVDGNLKFEPGQFVQLSLPRFGEVTLAPCSSPDNHRFFELVVRAQGNTTNQLIKLLPGDLIFLRGPYGHGWPEGNLIGKNIIIVAGGMGIVPLRSLLYKIDRYKKEYKKIYIFAGFKTSKDILFEDDFLKWKNRFEYLKVAVERGDSDWWGETCLITEVIKKVKIDPNKLIVIMCGPEMMIPFCNQVLKKKKVKDNQIYISFERRMECGIGLCQHCNIGKYLVCQDGPVFRWDIIKGEISK